MLRPYAGYLLLAILTISLTLTACSDSNTPDETTTPSAGASPSASPTPTPSPEPSNSASDPAVTDRPNETTLEISTPDGYQPKPAVLKQGTGYSLYTIDGFDFDSSSGRLSLAANPGYYVDIQPLKGDYEETKQRDEGQNELKEFGTVSDYSGELVEHPLGYAELYLQASSGQGIRDYIVWKSEDGNRYLFRLHNPKGEDASAFAGAVFVMLATLK